MTTRTRITLEEFLAMPETEPPSELIDGEVVQKVAPSIFHAAIVAELVGLIREHLKGSTEARLVTELRHVQRSEERVFLPDINVTLRAHIPSIREAQASGAVEAAPDFAIEVLSPGDSPGRVLERADFYMRTRTSLLWIVDPENELVTVYRPGSPPEVHRGDDHLDGTPVLPRFRVQVADIFTVIHDD